MAAGGLDREIGEGRHLERDAPLLQQRPADGLEHLGPLLGREDRRLRGMDPDGDHDPVRHAAGLAQDVQVPVGDGVEAAGIEGGASHG